MSNSRSFRRSLKNKPHVRPSGQVQQQVGQGRYAKGHVPWNKGLALTATPTIGTVRRWCEACAAEGWIERKGVVRTGKPGRPAVLWGLTEAGWKRAAVNPADPPEVRRMQRERQRRVENARKRRGMQRRTRRLKALEAKAAKAGQKLQVATDAHEKAKADLLTAEIMLRATKALLDAGTGTWDAAVLLPEEIDVLTETGCAIQEGGRLLLAEDWVEAFRRITQRPDPDA